MDIKICMASDREKNKTETQRNNVRKREMQREESGRTADTAIKMANAFNLKCCASDNGHGRW